MSASARQQRQRILLVEDDEQVRLLIEDLLLDSDYEVEATSTVAGGRSLLDLHRYDLLVSDGMLPDGTGMQVAERAQELGMKVLIVTGYAFALPREQLARYAVLSKPVRMGDLLQAIEQVLLA
jgi:DNA-binding NtrC family response regulator